MASRPRRYCAEQALQSLLAFSNDSDEDMDVFDDAENDITMEDDAVVREAAQMVNMPDDIMDQNALEIVYQSDDETSLSETDDVDIQNEATEQIFCSRSGRLWNTSKPSASSGRQPSRNIIHFNEGPTPNANPQSEKDAILMFLSSALETTVLYSNLQGRRIIANWNIANPHKRKTFKQIDIIEMEAFLGLLVLLGAFRARYRDVDELWSTRDGYPICRATMTRERFVQIKSVLRFDDPLRRDRHDKLAPVRDMFQEFNSNLSRHYVPSPYLTIDEQLLEYHGRVRFRQYISSKPGKFGIKILWLCCAESYYILNGVIYIGVGTVVPNENLTTFGVTMHLMQPFLNTGRHLTGDNWFSSMQLVDALREKDTSYIGTMRNNNRDVPDIAKSTVGRQRKDTRIFYDEKGNAMVSFWDKGTKPVILVDSFHTNVPLPEINTKSCTVLEYNRTKSGVDMADKRLRAFSCKRKCKRWPFSIFCNMVDIAGNNGSIIFFNRYPHAARKQGQHYRFLVNAGYDLVDRHIRRRLQQGPLRATIQTAMKLVGYDIPAQSLPSEERLQKPIRCGLCPPKRDRKTSSCCPRCHRPRCTEHRSHLCTDCSTSV